MHTIKAEDSWVMTGLGAGINVNGGIDRSSSRLMEGRSDVTGVNGNKSGLGVETRARVEVEQYGKSNKRIALEGGSIEGTKLKQAKIIRKRLGRLLRDMQRNYKENVSQVRNRPARLNALFGVRKGVGLCRKVCDITLSEAGYNYDPKFDIGICRRKVHALKKACGTTDEWAGKGNDHD